ncbi:MAG: DUF411 domain-containing protein [Magnetococcales bacterium]|nr:DUF411 domain-containing protein [Magnetococcales bacterium]
MIMKTVGKTAKKPAWAVLILALVATGWLFFSQPALAATQVVVYKSPYCGCCDGWVKYLESNGFAVTVKNVEDVQPIKARLGVPPKAASCHTAKVGRYVVEGHVPVEDIHRMLKQKPQITGIAAPGMPVGSPGMEIPDQPADRYDIITFKNGKMGGVYSRH